jgi:hypothetical protein
MGVSFNQFSVVSKQEQPRNLFNRQGGLAHLSGNLTPGRFPKGRERLALFDLSNTINLNNHRFMESQGVPLLTLSTT